MSLRPFPILFSFFSYRQITTKRQTRTSDRFDPAIYNTCKFRLLNNIFVKLFLHSFFVVYSSCLLHFHEKETRENRKIVENRRILYQSETPVLFSLGYAVQIVHHPNQRFTPDFFPRFCLSLSYTSAEGGVGRRRGGCYAIEEIARELHPSLLFCRFRSAEPPPIKSAERIVTR